MKDNSYGVLITTSAQDIKFGRLRTAVTNTLYRTTT